MIYDRKIKDKEDSLLERLWEGIDENAGTEALGQSGLQDLHRRIHKAERRKELRSQKKLR